jgi:hypothetical protein
MCWQERVEKTGFTNIDFIAAPSLFIAAQSFFPLL